MISRSVWGKISRLLPVFVLAVLAVRAQSPKLPAGYSVQESQVGTPVMVRADLDGDGQIDIFCAVQSDGQLKLFASLQSGCKTIMSQDVGDGTCCGSVSAKNGVVRVSSTGMRAFSYYKWRYNKVAGDFQLIGFDTESFGNAANDGSGTSSLNLLTGDYVDAFNSYNQRTQRLKALPKTRKKVRVTKRIFLKDWNDSTETWVSDLAYRQLPRQMQ